LETGLEIFTESVKDVNVPCGTAMMPPLQDEPQNLPGDPAM